MNYSVLLMTALRRALEGQHDLAIEDAIGSTWAETLAAASLDGAREAMEGARDVSFAEVDTSWVPALAKRYTLAVARTIGRSAVRRVAETTRVESTMRAITKGRGQGAMNRERLLDAIRVGKTAREDPALGEALRSLDLELRTRVAEARTSGALAAGRVAGAGLRFETMEDERVRDNHAAAEGLTAAARDPVWLAIAPPLGFNCFLPGTIVEGRFEQVRRFLYSGQAVEVTTQGGRRLRVTANHPIATVGGWVTAARLKRGAQLLAYPAGEARAPADQVNEHDMPASVEQVFRACAERARVVTVNAVGHDFHGDAAGAIGEVEVVAAHGDLLSQVEAYLRGETHDPHFVVSAAGRDATLRAPGFTGSRALGHLLGRPSPSAARLPRLGQLPLDGLGVLLEPNPLHTLRVGLSAECDASLAESGSEDGAAYARLVAQLLDRVPGEIALDQIVEVRHFDWTGHVYDLQDERGWLVSNGIVASNCRCSVRLVPRAVLRERGLVDARGKVIRYVDLPRGAHADEGFTPSSLPHLLAGL